MIRYLAVLALVAALGYQYWALSNKLDDLTYRQDVLQDKYSALWETYKENNYITGKNFQTLQADIEKLSHD